MLDEDCFRDGANKTMITDKTKKAAWKKTITHLVIKLLDRSSRVSENETFLDLVTNVFFALHAVPFVVIVDKTGMDSGIASCCLSVFLAVHLLMQ